MKKYISELPTMLLLKILLASMWNLIIQYFKYVHTSIKNLLCIVNDLMNQNIILGEYNDDG